MSISRFGGALAVCGAIMAFIGFVQGSSAYQDDVSTLGYFVGAWIGVGIAVVGFCVWMSTPRGKAAED